MQVTRLTLSEISNSQQSAIDKLISDSFFASKSFMEVWKSISGIPVYWVVEENKEVVGVLPAVEFGEGKLKRLQALPDGCYSSIFVKDKTQIEKCTREILHEISSFGYQKIFIYDFYNSITSADGYDIQKCQTTLVDVSSDDWLPPDKKLQSEIRKAERENAQIENFDYSVHGQKFYELMISTSERHNQKIKYDESFLHRLAVLSKSDSRVLWYWCEYEGNAVSSHINFIENNQIINWQVFFNKKYSFLKANQKMLYDLAKVAQDKNIKYLNLGASPIETPTLIEYKNKWGGVTKEYNCYFKKSLLGKLF